MKSLLFILTIIGSLQAHALPCHGTGDEKNNKLEVKIFAVGQNTRQPLYRVDVWLSTEDTNEMFRGYETLLSNKFESHWTLNPKYAPEKSAQMVITTHKKCIRCDIDDPTTYLTYKTVELDYGQETYEFYCKWPL